MDITFDEWLYHYLIDEEKWTIADEILTKIYDKCDRIVCAKGSPMNEKINLLSKFESPKQIKIIKKFFMMFSYNSDKLLLLEENDLPPLPNEFIDSFEEKEDIYLVQTCLATNDKIIITEDKDFRDAINGKYGIKAKLVNEFLEEIKNAG